MIRDLVDSCGLNGIKRVFLFFIFQCRWWYWSGDWRLNLAAANNFRYLSKNIDYRSDQNPLVE